MYICTVYLQTWFVGSLYRRVNKLKSEYGLMVKVDYDINNMLSCSLVPFQKSRSSGRMLKEIV